MAIAFDTATDGGSGTGATLTWSHTCSGSNRLLVVGVVGGATDYITGVTYNGVAMTLVNKTIYSGQRYVYMFYLLNPASGAHNVVVSESGSFIIGVSASYTGVYQSGQPDAQTTNTSAGSPLTTSVTTVLDNCWTTYVVYTNGGTSSASTGSTLRVQSSSFNTPGFYDSNGVISPPGAYSMSVTTTGSGNAGVMASFAPDVTGPRYWVGGTGNWNDSSHWSASSGGSGGETVPSITNLNDAIFDANSGSGTTTVNATSTCVNLTCTGFTGTLTGSSGLTISGNLTLASGMTNSYTGAITFSSTASGKTITTAGKTIGSTITFNGSGGVWTLQDDFTSSTSITNTVGTVDFNGKNVSATTLSNAGTLTTGNGTLTFSSTGTNTGTMTLGTGSSLFTTFTNSGTLTLSSGTTSLTGTGTVWTNTGTFTCGTSTIKLTNASSSSKTFAGNGGIYNNLWITGSGTGAYTISGNNTFNDFKIDTPPHTVNFTALSRQTLNTFTCSGTAGNLVTLQSTSTGSPWYLEKVTAGNVVCDYLSLQDSHVTTL